MFTIFGFISRSCFKLTCRQCRIDFQFIPHDNVNTTTEHLARPQCPNCRSVWNG